MISRVRPKGRVREMGCAGQTFSAAAAFFGAGLVLAGCARAATPDGAVVRGDSGDPVLQPAPDAAGPSAALVPVPARPGPEGSVPGSNDGNGTAQSPVAPPAGSPDGGGDAAAHAADPQTEPADFIGPARVLFRVGACGPAGDLPPGFDAANVDRHCEELTRAYDEYKRTWVDVAEPFLASLRPPDLPPYVLYPFGGGDLVSALTTFPEAAEITTISLEPAGDIRPIQTLSSARLTRELAEHAAHLERLFEKAHSRTDNLEKESKTELPGELLFALAALVVHGDQPIGLRYFRLTRDGSLSYVTPTDIANAEKTRNAAAVRALFANAELSFQHPGGKLQVFRHISYNLDDTHLRADPGLLAYLSGKENGKGGTPGHGRYAAMTKAASHLLWNENFSKFRSWLVDHTDWMVSDSTGLPPRAAGAAGFAQETYGTFDGPAPYGAPDAQDGFDLKRIFSSQQHRDLPFRYGYPDRNGHAHLVVTRRDTR
jgi:hypothetical protein